MYSQSRDTGSIDCSATWRDATRRAQCLELCPINSAPEGIIHIKLRACPDAPKAAHVVNTGVAWWTLLQPLLRILNSSSFPMVGRCARLRMELEPVTVCSETLFRLTIMDFIH